MLDIHGKGFFSNVEIKEASVCIVLVFHQEHSNSAILLLGDSYFLFCFLDLGEREVEMQVILRGASF